VDSSASCAARAASASCRAATSASAALSAGDSVGGLVDARDATARLRVRPLGRVGGAGLAEVRYRRLGDTSSLDGRLLVCERLVDLVLLTDRAVAVGVGLLGLVGVEPFLGGDAIVRVVGVDPAGAQLGSGAVGVVAGDGGVGEPYRAGLVGFLEYGGARREVVRFLLRGGGVGAQPGRRGGIGVGGVGAGGPQGGVDAGLLGLAMGGVQFVFLHCLHDRDQGATAPTRSTRSVTSVVDLTPPGQLGAAAHRRRSAQRIGPRQLGERTGPDVAGPGSRPRAGSAYRGHTAALAHQPAARRAGARRVPRRVAQFPRRRRPPPSSKSRSDSAAAPATPALLDPLAGLRPGSWGPPS